MSRGPGLDEDRQLELPRSRDRSAWLLSAMLHTTLVLVLGLLFEEPPEQASGPAERPAGIALVQRNRTSTSYYWEDTAGESAGPPAVVSLGSALPDLSQLPEATFALPTAADLAAAAAASLPAADAFTSSGQPSNRLAGGGARTQVFGAEGSGSKFVYVFDRSASMEGFQGRPMEAAKAELVRSLRDLDSVHQFQIVFYNERTAVFHPFPPEPPRMMFGSDENKQLAEEYVRAVAPAGATRHMQALELAVGMRPDVIFFLTDAAEPRLTAAQLERIRRRNAGGAVINTIEFGSGPDPGSDNFLVRLARQNKGQHVYVDLTALPPTGQGSP